MSSLAHAVAEAAQRERRFLWGLCYRMTGSAADAEDVVQEALLKALEVRPSTDAALRPWLTRVALHLAVDRLRRRTAEPLTSVYLPGLIETPEELWDAAPSTAAEYGLRESVGLAFLLALEVLSPEQRAAVLLRDVFDFTAREVAEVLDTSEANVRQLHHRAREALRPYDEGRRLPDAALREDSRRLLAGLFQALQDDDAAAAVALLREDVKGRSDGGGRYFAANVVLHGPERVFTLYSRLMALRSPTSARFTVCNGLWVVDAAFEAAQPKDAPRAITGVLPDGVGGAALVFSQLVPERLPDAARPWPGWER